jgi:glycosyltransferase involved in cell wall biosynthesis
VVSERPLVTVLSPALDAERFIEATIQSVLAQDYEPVEHIVLLAGSTDSTAALVGRYPSLVAVADGPLTLSSKLNYGVEISSGEIIGCLSCDDLYLPGAISAAVETLTESPDVGMVYADHREIDADGHEIRSIHCPDFDLSRQLNRGNVVSQPTAFFRRETFTRAGRFDERLHYAIDYELWIRIGKCSEIRHVREYWAAYRRHQGQLTHVHARELGAEIRKASRLHGGRFFSEVGFAHSRPLRLVGRVLNPNVRRRKRPRQGGGGPVKEVATAGQQTPSDEGGA